MGLIVFSAIAGAVQMMTPDRWMPASLFAWQRGYGSFRSGLLTILYSTIHVALGFGLFALLARPLSRVPEEYLGLFTLAFLGVFGVARIYRFNRIREIMTLNRSGVRATVTLLALWGPSEMVIPVLMRARMDGIPPLPALIPLWAGTAVAGIVAVAVARASWNKPFVLPSIFQWCESKRVLLPVSLGAVVGIALISLRSLNF